MKLIRYLDRSGRIQYAAEQPDGAKLRLEGDPFGQHRVTQEPATITKILAPVVPAMIWCIGQNYRRHADEVGMSSGDYPVVFATLYIFSLIGVVVNLISDLTYTWIDPRIDFETREV